MSGEQAKKNAMTEAGTCRESDTPEIVQARWSDAPFTIGEQRRFTHAAIREANTAPLERVFAGGR